MKNFCFSLGQRTHKTITTLGKGCRQLLHERRIQLVEAIAQDYRLQILNHPPQFSAATDVNVLLSRDPSSSRPFLPSISLFLPLSLPFVYSDALLHILAFYVNPNDVHGRWGSSGRRCP